MKKDLKKQEKSVKNVSKRVIDKLFGGTNFVNMKQEAKSGIFKNLFYSFDDIQHGKNYIMQELSKKVIKQIEESELPRWKAKIIEQLRNENKVCKKKKRTHEINLFQKHIKDKT